MSLKNYLSKNERDNWLLAMSSTMYLNNIMNIWGNNLTSEEKRKIKTSITMTQNALKSVADRMPEHEKAKIVKHAKDYEIRLFSVEGAKAIEKSSYEKYGHIRLTEKEAKVLINDIVSLKCADCLIPCDKCITYEIFQNSLVPRLDEENNCPYAYRTDAKVEDDFYVAAQKINKIHKKVSKRKQKKLKNRFDDEDDVYEYNFTPKGAKK